MSTHVYGCVTRQLTRSNSADTLLKDDLVAALEETLEANETTFAKQPAFTDYYGRSSPIKRERSSPDVFTAPVARTRRQTLNKNSDT